MILGNQITFNPANIDTLAVIITVVGYTVVFIALAVLVLVIGRISTIHDFIVRMRMKSTRKDKPGEPEPPLPQTSLSADENAAICTALYLFFSELHDEEKYVMTVKKVSRTYSPWSSKIYGIMNFSKRG